MSAPTPDKRVWAGPHPHLSALDFNSPRFNLPRFNSTAFSSSSFNSIRRRHLNRGAAFGFTGTRHLQLKSKIHWRHLPRGVGARIQQITRARHRIAYENCLRRFSAIRKCADNLEGLLAPRTTLTVTVDRSR